MSAGACLDQKRAQDGLEIEFQAVKGSVWVLGIRLRPSTKSNTKDIIFSCFTEVNRFCGFILARGPVSQTTEPLRGFDHSTSSARVTNAHGIHLLTLQKGYGFPRVFRTLV